MKKKPQNSAYTYLNPTRFGKIINRRNIQYSTEAEGKIIRHLGEINPEITKKQLGDAIEEIKECLSPLSGLFLPKEVSKEQINKLAQELFKELDINLADGQKDKLRDLISGLSCLPPAFGKEMGDRAEEAAKATLEIVVIVKPANHILSLDEMKTNLKVTNKRMEIKNFFLKNLISDVYKDPSTAKRTESAKRFRELYKTVHELEKGLQSLTQRDEIQLKKEISAISSSTITLQTIEQSLWRLKIVLGKLKDNPGSSGKASPAFWETILELAYIYNKYTGKKPDRSKSGFGIFTKLVIESIFPLKKFPKDAIRKVTEFYNKNTKEIREYLKKVKNSKSTDFPLTQQEGKCRECGDPIPEKLKKLDYCEVCIASPKIFLKAQKEKPQH